MAALARSKFFFFTSLMFEISTVHIHTTSVMTVETMKFLMFSQNFYVALVETAVDLCILL